MFLRLPALAAFVTVIVADTNFVSGAQKNVSDFDVSQFAQPKKHHEQRVLVCQGLNETTRPPELSRPSETGYNNTNKNNLYYFR